MRKLALGFVLALLVAPSSSAIAAPIVIALHAGASSPTNDFGDSADLGLQGAWSGTWMLGPGWGIGVDVGYHRWGGNDELDAFFRQAERLSGATPPYQAEVRLRAIQFTAHGLYRFPPTDGAQPWLKAGLGLYVLSSDLVNAQVISLDASKSYFGMHVGAGIDFPLGSGFSVGFEAGFQRIHLGHLDAATFDPDNWYLLRFEDADTFQLGMNLTWGGAGR